MTLAHKRSNWLRSLAQYGPRWLVRKSMTEQVTSKMYDVWASFYDYTFGALVTRRQEHAVRHLKVQSGDRILDMGTGTGKTLPMQRRDVTVVGMDLSAGMLAKAQGRCRDNQLDHCSLVRCDAMLPPFADQSFDHILIAHTITVVSDPAKLLDWATRLLKPGGRIVVLNHFQSSQPIVAWFERVLNPMFVRIGWKSDLALEDVLNKSDLRVAYRFKLGLWDLWQIVVLTGEQHTADAAAQSQAAVEAQAQLGDRAGMPKSPRLAIDSGRYSGR